ncbi:DNA-directed RNA polymerase sigma-70 factor [Actinocatenispora thailandica]|uniref:DNA-directed RNA polymerase sigma-70 factor n=1 Tax=Actinocatenispora thailandica TaxID=227318 RepID=A0A7R7DRZ5_9ACTN|nr:sigma-70 family RNA polymerase sigma factor [Actinocatenispora thailandica]BCJ36699.1 DNA-directed RNA polymerase sigma-70 factor [Actinocatenispora thailandica]
MQVDEELAARFEAERGQLRAVAYRMLGSPEAAEDAVQEAWLRLGRVDAGEVANLGGWLRTVVTRICLDVLRTRRTRREDPTGMQQLDEVPGTGAGPADTAVLADSVSRALLVVLDTLTPAERVAFVLHDMFAVPFDQIAPIVSRSPVAAKKLASRARQKVQGTPAVPADELARQRRVVAAFLAAARAGDLAGILAVLAPDVVRRADPAALAPGAAAVVRGAQQVARGTVALAGRSRQAELVLLDGRIGAIVAPGGRLRFALAFDVDGDLITGYEVIADPDRLARLDLAVLD